MIQQAGQAPKWQGTMSRLLDDETSLIGQSAYGLNHERLPSSSTWDHLDHQDEHTRPTQGDRLWKALVAPRLDLKWHGAAALEPMALDLQAMYMHHDG